MLEIMKTATKATARNKVKILKIAKKLILLKVTYSRRGGTTSGGAAQRIEYEGNGDSKNVACVKAENVLVPFYRKELRKVLLVYLQWMRAIKKDPTYRI